jgi:hypothetical protein
MLGLQFRENGNIKIFFRTTDIELFQIMTIRFLEGFIIYKDIKKGAHDV